MKCNRKEYKSAIRKRYSGLVKVLAVLLASILLNHSLSAQIAGDGSIQGRITDQSGAVIAGATITAVENATGVSTIRKSTSAGFYAMTTLPAGKYTVTVTAPGFNTSVQEHVQVNATLSVGLDFKMTVGQSSQKVTVTSAPPALDTTNATLSEVMENSTYEQLPLIMNSGPLDPTAFVGLMQGVSNGGRSGVFNGMGGSGGYTDEIYMDGVPLTMIGQQGDNRNVQLGVSVDAVNQFEVITSGASAQYTGLGVTNWTMKSGTNQYHGSAYTAFRNTAFDAWSYFAKAATINTLVNGIPKKVPAPKPAEHQNEISLTFGGPVRIPHLYDGRNKLFLFASYVYYHATFGVNPQLVSVPTSRERTGDFTQLADGAKIYDPTTTSPTCASQPATCTSQQFMGSLNGVPTPNVIPTAEISPQAQYMQKFLPLPDNENITQNNLLSGLPQGNANFTINTRTDYQLSPKQRLSVVGGGGVRNFLPCDFCGPLPFPYANGVYVTESTATGILEDDYVISDRMVNNLRYAYDRLWVPVGNLTYKTPQYEARDFINNLPPGEASLSFPSVNFFGFADNPTSWSSVPGYLQNENTYDIVDNLVRTHGQHNTTVGVVWQWLNENQNQHDTPTTPLFLAFSNVSTAGYNAAGQIENTNSGNPYASFLIGAVDFTGVDIQPFTVLGARYKALSPYIQDDWSITPKLTLNLGLRWDLFTPFEEVQNRWSFMNPHLINPATGSYGAIQFAGFGADSCDCRTPLHTYYGNIGPRLGLAYSVNRKTVVRGGFSIVYSHAGGTGGRVGAQNGTGQTGLTASTFYPSSGQAGAIPAFYLNNSSGFQAKGLANDSLPPYITQDFVNPMVNSGNYINNGIYPLAPAGAPVIAQGVGYGDRYLGGRAPYSETYNFGVQRAITDKLTLEINYAGSESHFLTSYGARGEQTNQLNPQYEVLGSLLKQLPGSIDRSTGRTYLEDAKKIIPGIGLPFTNFGGPQATIQAMLQPFPQYGGIQDTYGDVGNATYNSLQITLSQQPWHGLFYTLNYSYSKEFDDTGTYRSGWAIPGNVMTDGIPRKQNQVDRSLGTTDEPQILHIYGVWDTPFGHGERNLRNILTSGWAFSSIFSYNSGSPLAITTFGCQVIGQGTCMPSYTPGYSKSPRIHGKWGHGITAATAATTPYIDATAFTVPNQTYQIGNIARTGAYNLFGPDYMDLDSGLSRAFKIKDNLTLMLNATATNVFNSVFFNLASTTVTPGATVPGKNSLGTNVKSNFGTLGSQGNAPRDWQFSGKISF